MTETTAKYDKLLKFLYDEYDRGHNASGYGERVSVLVQHFERSSQQNRIGDALEQMAAVSYLHDSGWIDLVDTLGNTITNPIRAFTIGRMKPTPKGRDYLQHKRIDSANTVASVSGTFFGKLFKAWFGK